MDSKIAIKYVNDHYTYVSDEKNYNFREAWVVMKEPPFKGDCEDYSLTVLYHIADKSIFKLLWLILTFQAAIIGCKSPDGGGHAVLRYKNLYIDNWQKRLVSIEFLKNRGYKFNNLIFYIHWLPLVQVFKLLIGFVVKLLKKGW